MSGAIVAREESALAVLDTALAVAVDGYEIIAVRDEAQRQSVRAALSGLKADAARLSGLVLRAERAFVEATPPLASGTRTDLVASGNEVYNAPPIAPSTIRNWRSTYKGVSDADIAELEGAAIERGDTVSQNDVRRLQRKRRDDAAQRKHAERESKPPAEWQPVYHNKGVADMDLAVPPESIDLILTDPPYERSALSAYHELAGFAAHALRPGGQLAVMTGAHMLPDVFAALEHADLEWRDLIAYGLPRANSVVWSSRTMVSWKPVLVYAKPPREAWPRFANVVYPEGVSAQVEGHKWGQNLDGFIKLTEMLAEPGQTICDPFMGGGTTAEAAMERGCAFIGADIDAACIDATKERLS